MDEIEHDRIMKLHHDLTTKAEKLVAAREEIRKLTDALAQIRNECVSPEYPHIGAPVGDPLEVPMAVKWSVDKLRDRLHDLETASWADAVQDAAAWKERALVAETALVEIYKKMKLVESKVNEIHSQVVPMGTDWGDSGVERLSKEALDLMKRSRFPLITGGPDMSQTLISFKGLRELRDAIDKYLKEHGDESTDSGESQAS